MSGGEGAQASRSCEMADSCGHDTNSGKPGYESLHRAKSAKGRGRPLRMTLAKQEALEEALPLDRIGLRSGAAGWHQRWYLSLGSF